MSIQIDRYIYQQSRADGVKKGTACDAAACPTRGGIIPNNIKGLSGIFLARLEAAKSGDCMLARHSQSLCLALPPQNGRKPRFRRFTAL